MDIKDLSYELTVSKIVPETDEAASFFFSIPEPLKTKFNYKAGQFITLIFNIDGQEVKRSYSLSSSPALNEEFSVTVKRVKNGLVSNHLLNSVKVGDRLLSTPPAGLFTPKNLDTPRLYLLFAAGSGITPMYSIMKTVLHSHPESQVMLVYSNRNEDQIIFKKEISQLQSTYTSRLKVFYCCSQPSQPCEYQGRLSPHHLHKIWDHLKDISITQEAYLCGPDGFMETAKAFLSTCGLTQDHIFQESFTTNYSSKKSSDPELSVEADWVLIGDQSKKSSPKELEVVLDGETSTIPYNGEQSILEVLLENGKNPPYSCMDGACMACLGKVCDGLVYQEDQGVLADENIADGETLTCQARSLSKKVRIDFDNF